MKIRLNAALFDMLLEFPRMRREFYPCPRNPRGEGLARNDTKRSSLKTQHEALVKGLFQLVWADDVVSPNEVHALTAVLLRLGFSLPEVICLLDGNLAAPPPNRTNLPLDQIFANHRPSEEELKLLLAICFSEGTIQPAQIGYIEGLILRLGLSAEDLERLRADALGTLGL